VGPNACVVTLDADSENHVAGISLVDGNDLRKNGTGRSTSGFVNGRTSRIVCSVGPGKVDVEWDGQLAVNWRGEERRLSLPGQWSVPDTSCPFLGTNFTSFRITKAELLPAR